MRIRLLTVALLVGLSGQSGMSQSVPAITNITGGTVNYIPTYTVGWKFRLDRSVVITHLGVYDANNDGVLNEPSPPTVGIWNTSGQLLVSNSVPLGTAPQNRFFYSAITPFNLDSGDYVIGAVNYAAGERFVYDCAISSIAPVTWLEGRYIGSSTLEYPSGTYASKSYFGPNFMMEPLPPEAITIQTPATRRVFQRDKQNYANIALSGTFSGVLSRVEVRVTPVSGYSGTAISGVTLDASPTNGLYSGTVKVKGGWYDVEVIGILDGQGVSTAKVSKVGVGEVVVTCGQSNSANYGQPGNVPADDRVNCYDMAGTWRHAYDPQPYAAGTGGSPWPAFGDKLAQIFDVPVGIISLGIGSTTVSQWVPGSAYYSRISSALAVLGTNGCRACLWHQGESDSLSYTTTSNYAAMLNSIISQSRQDAGYPVPWGIAIASWHPSATAQAEALIAAAQQQVLDTASSVFKGAQTDSFHTNGLLYDTVHFNTAGLQNHGRQWAEALRAFSFPKPGSQPQLNLAGASSGPATILSWNSETGVIYSVQATDCLIGDPVAWSNVGEWCVGPDMAITNTFGLNADTLFFRLRLPYTDY